MYHNYIYAVKKLYLQYAIRLAANSSKSANEVSFSQQCVDLYHQGPLIY